MFASLRSNVISVFRSKYLWMEWVEGMTLDGEEGVGAGEQPFPK